MSIYHAQLLRCFPIECFRACFLPEGSILIDNEAITISKHTPDHPILQASCVTIRLEETNLWLCFYAVAHPEYADQLSIFNHEARYASNFDKRIVFHSPDHAIQPINWVTIATDVLSVFLHMESTALQKVETLKPISTDYP